MMSRDTIFVTRLGPTAVPHVGFRPVSVGFQVHLPSSAVAMAIRRPPLLFLFHVKRCRPGGGRPRVVEFRNAAHFTPMKAVTG